VTQTLSLRRRVVNDVMLSMTAAFTVLVIGVLFIILGYLAWNGVRFLSWNFFTQLPKPVGETGGGMANAIVGSGKLLMLASMIGIPIGFLGGVYLSEFGGEQSLFPFVVRYTTDLLNGVPSIVIGIFAYAVAVMPRHHYSAYAGGFALGIMMIPIALRSTEEFLRGVPNTMREGAMALGASKAQTIVTVVIPAALKGIISGMMLDLARVAGETAPLIFTAFGNAFWSKGLDDSTASLPVMIYHYAQSPYEDWHQQAWAAGFVLLTLVFLVNIIARGVLSRTTYK
jgi:phosphate transport system permease protein